jgi:hypothetical protein
MKINPLTDLPHLPSTATYIRADGKSNSIPFSLACPLYVPRVLLLGLSFDLYNVM